MFAYSTGWREAEILSLQWPQVDFAAGTVTLEVGTAKNDKGRVLPFSGLDELRTMLEARRKLPVE